MFKPASQAFESWQFFFSLLSRSISKTAGEQYWAIYSFMNINTHNYVFQVMFGSQVHNIRVTEFALYTM